jgi:nucleoside-diphosphate kinase
VACVSVLRLSTSATGIITHGRDVRGPQTGRGTMETTLVLLKPDAVRRNLMAEIIGRFERRGFRFRGMRLIQLDRATAETHYAEHSERPFFGELVDFITSGPILALALEGEGAVLTVRDMMGKTNPLDSAPGTIRGDLALLLAENIIHGSDSVESAERELAIYFPDGLL